MRSRTGLVAVLLLAVAAPALAQGRLVHDTIHSAALAGSLSGERADREVLVYLPPGYDTTSRRFPVLYLLHGQTSEPVEWVDGTYQDFRLPAAMDSLVAAGGGAYIVVMPHANTTFGGSFYVDSGMFGGWETFIARELVQHVDARYRTLATSRSRGLAGFSLGGFGALYIGARHAATFGLVYAMSPCCTGFVGELAPGSDVWRQAWTLPLWAQGSSGAVRRVWMMSAAFAAPGEAVPLRAQPYVGYATQPVTPVEPVLRLWRERLPLETVARDAAAYRGLHRLVLEYGRADQIASVVEGTRALAARLTELGVPHTLDAHDGDHVGRVRERMERALLPFFGRELQR